MRLLLIEDDAAQCEIIQHRLTSRTPDAQIVVRNPDLHGPLAPEFLAQGFDAVLLGDGRGLDELRDLTGRAGFAPVILIATHVDPIEAKVHGAHAVVSRDEIQTEHFFRAVADAQWTQSRARQKWQTSPAGRETQSFGGAFIRGYRCIRRIASGPVSDLYMAESESAGALVALKVAAS